MTTPTLAGTVRPGWLPPELPEEKYVLVGLHCCGDLRFGFFKVNPLADHKAVDRAEN